MSLESVRQFFAERAPEIDIIEMPYSTATVEMAARVHGVAPGQIAKTLSLKVRNEVILVVTCGDARLD
ncbi:cys-tRNA(pro)/cys-tRNA(cys) deacylase, partial [Pantoea ananatis]